MPLNSIDSQLGSVTPATQKSVEVSRRVAPLPAKSRKNRRLLLAMLRSCFPAVGLYLAALPAAQAQYGIFTNPITGTNPNTSDPYTTGQIVAPNLTVTGIGRGTGIAGVNTNDAYNADGWSTGALDVNDYYTWTMTPGTGYTLDLSNFAYTSQISSGTGQVSYRSSLDAFTANIGTPTVSTTNTNNVIGLSSAYRDLQSAVSFQLYAHNLGAASTTFRVNDFAYNGLVSIRWNGMTDGDISNTGNYVNSNSIAAGNGIQFEGAANTTVNVGSATTIAGIRFAAGASPFTINGSPISLGSAGGIANYSTNPQTINTNVVIPGGSANTTNFNTANGDITLAGVLSATASSPTITKTGSGTLFIGNANVVAGLSGGTTTLSAGTTKILTPAATATPFGTSSVTLALGATFDTNGSTNLSMVGATNGLRGTLTNTGSATTSWGNAITNHGSFTVDGTAAGGITFGTLTGNAGNAVVKNGSNTLTFGGGSNNGNLALTVNSGTVVLAKTSSATVHAINGPVVVNGGTLQLGGTNGDQIFNDASVPVTLLGGTFDIGAANETLTGTLQIGNGTLNGTITGTTGTLSNNTTVSAQSGSSTAIMGGIAGITKTTSGSVTLSGANTYIGPTTVSTGTLIAANNKALGYSGTTGVGVTSAGTSVTAGAVLDVSGQSSIQENITLNGDGTGAGALINSSGTAATIGGGVATLTLLTGGGNYGTSAPTATVTGGGGSGATAAVTRGVTAATFTINGGTTVYSVAPNVAITSGNGTGATAVANLTAGVVTSITITNPGTGFSSTPNIGFSGGTITTSGTNPTGTGNNANFQISGITLNNGGTGFTSPPTVTISGANPGTATAALTQVTLGSTSSIGGTGDITINAPINESAAGFGLTKVGSNTLTLGADNNSYTGPTTVNAGTLKLVSTNTNNIPTSNQIALGGGTLDVSSVSGFALASNQILSGAGTVSGNLTAGTTTEVRPGGAGTAGTLNFGPLTLSGAGLTFDLGTTSDLIDLGPTNLLTGTGTNTFTLNSLTGFGVGNYTLIDYGTLDGGTSLSNFALSSPTLAGFNVALSDTGSAIVLNVTGGPSGPPTWQGANNDPWTAAGSWNGSVPNTNTAEAKFVSTGGTTATLDANQTINKLTFDSTNPHTISGSNTLTLAGTTPTISTAGTNNSTQTVAVNLDLAAGTAISVQGGTLELNSPANAVLGAGVTATVATGATLSLGGAGNALSNGTSTHANVNNSGTLLATSAGKRVGDIDGATGTTTVTAAGATLTANHIRQATLNIGAGNTVTVAANGGDSGTSTLTNLSINATGKLDLTNNDLIVDNGNLTTLTAKLASGLDITGSYGAGPGINGITSSTFANDPNFNTVLGIAANSELGYATFSGQTVDANDVLIKYTYFGDADLNGVVDGATDFDLYITGLTSGGSLGGWLYGDFDYNGTVDSATDFDLYITGFSSQGGPLLSGGGGSLVQAVPEPSTFVLAGLGALGFAGARLRRRRQSA